MLGSQPTQRMGEVEFTKDMVETMLQYFETYANSRGVMTILMRTDGLWLQHPETRTWQFLGLAQLPSYLVQ